MMSNGNSNSNSNSGGLDLAGYGVDCCDGEWFWWHEASQLGRGGYATEELARYDAWLTWGRSGAHWGAVGAEVAGVILGYPAAALSCCGEWVLLCLGGSDSGNWIWWKLSWLEEAEAEAAEAAA